MEKEEEKKDCCTTKKCCGCKALAALALLLVGGLIGYFTARHCCAKQCPVPAASAPVTPAK